MFFIIFRDHSILVMHNVMLTNTIIKHKHMKHTCTQTQHIVITSSSRKKFHLCIYMNGACDNTIILNTKIIKTTTFEIYSFYE